METELEKSRSGRSRHRWALIWVSVLLGVIATIIAANLVFRPPGYYPWYPFGFGWIWIPLVFFLAFFAVRWFFLPWGWGYSRRYWTHDDAYNILRERFARGEITREQLEQITRDLEGDEKRQ
jgi:uncharacterized membrane protein